MSSTYDLPTLARTIGGGTKDGHSLLQGWDVMVAYDETSLNNLLGQQGAAAAAVQTVPKFTITDKDDWDTVTTYDYDLSLSNPTLQFLPETGTNGDYLQISFRMTGKISKNKIEHNITDAMGITMTVMAPLVSAEGSISKVDGTFQADKQSVQNSSAIVMTPPSGKQNMVCICLQKNKLEGINFTSTTPDGQKIIGTGNTFAPAINNLMTHLDSAASLSFQLAGVQSVVPAGRDPGAIELQPVCFMFSLVPAADPTKGGALCMYICVENGVSGPGNGGGQPTGLGLVDPNTLQPIYPIPSGKTAAIYFNHTFVMDSIFLPTFTKAGLQDINKVKYDSEKGIHFTYKGPSSKGKFEGGRIALLGAPGQHYQYLDLDTVDFDLKDFQSELFIRAEPSSTNTALISYNLTSTAHRVGWTEHEEGYKNAGKAGTVKWEKPAEIGAFYLTLKWKGTSNWDANTSTSTPAISTSFDRDFKMETKAIPGEWKWYEAFIGKGWSSNLPNYWKPTSPIPPAVSFNFPQLGYFLETNLLLPGANIFTPDPPSSGIAIPWDMIITGSIASSIIHTPSPLPNGIHRPVPLAPNGINGTAPGLGTDPSSYALENKFLDETTAYSASNTLALDLFNAVQGDDIESDGARIDEVLAKHGYQDLDANKLSAITGYSLESEVAFAAAASRANPVPAPGVLRVVNGTATPVSPKPFMAAAAVGATSTTTFDLSVYSGVYAIDGDADGKQLIIHPDTLEITYDDKTATPTITDSTVTWSTGSEADSDLVSYSIIFTAARVGTTTIFQQSFSGTYTASGSTTATDFSGTKLASTPAFDIRLCAGIYEVKKPDDIEGSLLYVNMVDGKIEWEGTSYQPTTQLDATSGATYVSWTATEDDNKKTTYSVYFFEKKGKQWFSGTMSTSDGDSDFEGELKETESDEAASRWDKMEISAGVIDIIMSFITLAVMVKSVYAWRQRQELKKNGELSTSDERIIKGIQDALAKGRITMNDTFQKSMKTWVNGKDSKWKNSNSDEFNNDARGIIEKRIKDYVASGHEINEIVNEDGSMNTTSDFWDKVHKVLTDHVRKEMERFSKMDSMNPIPEVMRKGLKDLGYDTEKQNELNTEAFKTKIDTIVKGLMGDNMGGKTWASARANEIASGYIRNDYASMSQEVQEQINEYETTISEYKGKSKKANGKLDQIKEELKNVRDEDRKEKLQKNKEKLEADIKKMDKDYEDANNNIDGTIKEKERYDKKAEAAERNEQDERERGTKAAKEVFKFK